MREPSKVDCKFGTLLLYPRNSNSISVRTGELKYDGVSYWLTIHGVEYDLSTRMDKGEDGLWHIAGKTPNEQWQYLSAKRRDWLSNINNSDLSSAARPKLIAELEKVVTEWANAHPEVLHAATVEQVQEEIQRLEEKRCKLNDELLTLQGEINMKKDELWELEG